MKIINTLFFRHFSVFTLSLAIIAGCTTRTKKEEKSEKPMEVTWQLLFSGSDLSGWDTYLGPRYNPDKGDFDGEPVGLNNDPRNVFQVVELEGERVVRISGEEFGGMSTQQEFENYHFSLQFKWGEKKSAPRDKAIRDSGLLYHAHEPHGSEWFFWMKSQEFQIQEGDCGDYWGLGTRVNIPVKMNPDSAYVYDENGELLTFGSGDTEGNNVKKYPDAEKPNGEWNTLDLYTHGDTSYHVVNGVLAMKLYNSRKIVDGEEVPLTRGKIQIQSEGAEVFYKNFKIRSLDRLPEDI